MRCELKAGVLKSVVKALLTSVDEATLHFDPTGLTAKAVNPAHVLMVQVSLAKTAFVSAWRSEEGIPVTLNLDRLWESLRNVKEDDQVSLEAKDGRMILKCGPVTTRMTTLDYEGAEVKLPNNLVLPAHAFVLISEIMKFLKGAVGGEVVSIEIRPGEIELKAQVEQDTVELLLKPEDIAGPDNVTRVKSMFQFDYLESAVRAIGSDKCRIELGDDMPVHIASEGSDAQIEFWIAPRIESD